MYVHISLYYNELPSYLAFPFDWEIFEGKNYIFCIFQSILNGNMKCFIEAGTLLLGNNDAMGLGTDLAGDARLR